MKNVIIIIDTYRRLGCVFVEYSYLSYKKLSSLKEGTYVQAQQLLRPEHVKVTTFKRKQGSANLEATTWKRQLGSDNVEATTWKRQLGSENLEATTWKGGRGEKQK